MDKERWNYIKALQPPEGRWAHLSQSYVPERDEQGNIVGWSPVNRDQSTGLPKGKTFCEYNNQRKLAVREDKQRERAV